MVPQYEPPGEADNAAAVYGVDNAPKKQLPLRLSKKLYDELAAWAADDFRSVNGQIEYLLTECVKKRKKSGAEDR